VSIGPLAWRAAEFLVDGAYKPWAAVGDHVVFGKFAGEKLRYGDVKYILLDDKNIKWVVKDPTKLMNF
jgi:co-chaperonin GroES (HSP10)